MSRTRNATTPIAEVESQIRHALVVYGPAAVAEMIARQSREIAAEMKRNGAPMADIRPYLTIAREMMRSFLARESWES